jgi:hypothetical protein
MKIDNKAKGSVKKDKEKGHSDELEYLNKKRKIQTKVLQKMIENLNNKKEEKPANK